MNDEFERTEKEESGLIELIARICLEAVKQDRKCLNTQFPHRDSNRVPPECEFRALPLRQLTRSHLTF
jgi:hypothetical protein